MHIVLLEKFANFGLLQTCNLKKRRIFLMIVEGIAEIYNMTAQDTFHMRFQQKLQMCLTFIFTKNSYSFRRLLLGMISTWVAKWLHRILQAVLQGSGCFRSTAIVFISECALLDDNLWPSLPLGQSSTWQLDTSLIWAQQSGLGLNVQAYDLVVSGKLKDFDFQSQNLPICNLFLTVPFSFCR